MDELILTKIHNLVESITEGWYFTPNEIIEVLDDTTIEDSIVELLRQQGRNK